MPQPSRRPSPWRCCTPTRTPSTSACSASSSPSCCPTLQLSLSSDLVGTFREFERTATTALDAALSPLLADYLRRLAADARAQALPEPQIMQSSGGLTDVARASAHAALTVLSGPAGGVGGALLLAGLAGERDVLCFDMGGTSCDVCLIDDGDVAETAEREIAGRPLALPALDIHTVGAGGGSIAWRDSGGALRVGPQSAGAEPGPACYGRGGAEPTVTDANLLLGRLLADAPLAGGLALDRDAAERAVARLAAELAHGRARVREGIVEVAESEMLGALRLITVQRGIDPRRFALMPFGGAGPLHACAMAEQLGIARVLCPRASGVLCALGLAAAAPRHDLSRTVLLRGGELSAARLRELRESLLRRAGASLAGDVARERVVYELRYAGQSFELAVEQSQSVDPAELFEAFAVAHEQRYGYRDDDADIELVTVRVSVWGSAPELRPRGRRRCGGDAIRSAATHGAAGVHGAMRADIVFGGESLRATVLRGEPRAGTRVCGPALCALAEATLLVAPGWSGVVDEHGTLTLTHDAVPRRRDAASRTAIGRRARERARRDRAAGRHGRAARRLPGDGRRADPLGALLQHQGAPRRLDGAVRHRRPDDHAGRAHPRAPRLDARLGRRRARRAPRAGRLVDPQRPVQGRHAPARHHRHHARLRRRGARPFGGGCCSASPRAARTTRTSAGACPARCPPTAARSPRRAS